MGLCMKKKFRGKESGSSGNGSSPAGSMDRPISGLAGCGRSGAAKGRAGCVLTVSSLPLPPRRPSRPEKEWVGSGGLPGPLNFSRFVAAQNESIKISGARRTKLHRFQDEKAFQNLIVGTE